MNALTTQRSPTYMWACPWQCRHPIVAPRKDGLLSGKRHPHQWGTVSRPSHPGATAAAARSQAWKSDNVSSLPPPLPSPLLVLLLLLLLLPLLLLVLLLVLLAASLTASVRGGGGAPANDSTNQRRRYVPDCNTLSKR